MARPKYLQEVYLETPALALQQIQLETQRLGRQVAELSPGVGAGVISGSGEDLDSIVSRSSDNQRPFDEINEYNRQLAVRDLTGTDARRLAALSSVILHVQNVGETNAVNLVAIGRERLERGVTFSTETVEHFQVLGAKVREVKRSIEDLVTEDDLAAA